jgi:hypothetical protein
MYLKVEVYILVGNGHLVHLLPTHLSEIDIFPPKQREFHSPLMNYEKIMFCSAGSGSFSNAGSGAGFKMDRIRNSARSFCKNQLPIRVKH